MIHATVLYPGTGDERFDFDYYANSHMPMLANRFGEHCLGWSVDRVVDGPYVAVGHVLVDSMEGLNSTMEKHGEELMGDRVNWTDIEPVIVIADVVRDWSPSK
jgi:uncharacterized protein (TIGR02118 family)